ncbi:MAG: hypothetical protein AB1656_19555 [Candidatus Omnitrophota bacterium]
MNEQNSSFSQGEPEPSPILEQLTEALRLIGGLREYCDSADGNRAVQMALMHIREAYKLAGGSGETLARINREIGAADMPVEVQDAEFVLYEEEDYSEPTEES